MGEDTTASGLIDESARREFELAWLAGRPRPIEQFLPPTDSPDHLPTLAELILIELEMAWKARMALPAGPRPLPVEDYLTRFPLLDQPALVLQLVKEEYRARHACGDRPSPEEYRRRFPSILLSGEEIDITLPRPLSAAQDELPAVPGYEVLGRLGEGGMGVVYRARQLSLNRHVALKMLSPHAIGRREEMARFRAEAESVARLRHPNIVAVHEVGDVGGRPYFALELVEGGNLAQQIAGTPQPIRPAAQLVELLARAVHYAHGQGVVHRDLKPANVLLAGAPDGTNRTDRSDRSYKSHEPLPKITDFGLAKRLDETGHTQTGAVMGTPSYMAPEQALGLSKEVGPGADVYALGAILYELLTGRPPFKAETILDTLEQVRTQEPVPPRRLRPKAPVDLETICLKCLRKLPAQRYDCALALADDLARFLAGKPIRARPVGPIERLRLWGRRNPAPAAAGALVALALLTVVALSVAFAVQQTNAANRLEKEQARTQAALKKAEHLSAGLALDRGLTFCEQGDVRLGLLWLARALRLAPAEDEGLRWAVRANLALWSGQVVPLRTSLPGRSEVLAGALSRDGKVGLSASADNNARLWDMVTGQPLGAPLAHPDKIVALAFSPDGRTALTGGLDGTARLWNVPAGRHRATLKHQGPVRAVAFLADGRTVLTGGDLVRRWDGATGKALGSVRLDKDAGAVLAFSPDGKVALTANGPTARLHDTDNGDILGGEITQRGLIGDGLGTFDIEAAVFSPDGQFVLTCGQDGTARLRNAATGEFAGPPLVHQGAVHVGAFSSDGRVILTGSADGTARLWDASTGSPLGAPLLHTGSVRAVAVGPGGRSLLTGGRDGTVRLWEADVGPLLGARLPSAIVSWGPLLSADGSRLLAGGLGGTACLWDVPSGKLLGQLLGDPDSPGATSAAFSPDGRFVLTGAFDGTVRRWDREGKPSGPPFPAHGAAIQALAFRSDGKVVVTGSADKTARLWDLSTGKFIGAPLVHGEGVDEVAFAPDGKTVVTANRAPAFGLGGGALPPPFMPGPGMKEPPLVPGPGMEVKATVRLWDAATGRASANLPQQGTDQALVFRPDGKALLTAGPGGVRVWDTTSGRLLLGPFAADGRALVAAYAPAGDLLLTGGGDAGNGGEAQFRVAQDGGPLGPPLPHRGPVRAVAFSPDGKMVLTGSEDRTARLWDTATSRPLGPAIRHRGLVFGVAFSADGRTVLTSGQAPEARLSRLPPPVADVPYHVSLWAEALTGMELDEDGVARRLDDGAWAERRRDLAEMGGAPRPFFARISA